MARSAGPSCVVSLHGKGGFGSSSQEDGSATLVAPTGNADGWGGRQWLYETNSQYSSARGIVAAAIDDNGCGRVVLYGFSNGAAFAAKLYCRGETFGGRVVGVVVDDPVTDHAVDGCRPAGGVDVKLYWTGALEPPDVAGWACDSGDWTCQGSTTIGIAAYASALRTSATRSPFSDHQPYNNAPELAAWR
jgi:pimeloyl-ACP methyl ester carboxylesterase